MKLQEIIEIFKGKVLTIILSENVIRYLEYWLKKFVFKNECNLKNILVFIIIDYICSYNI